MTKGGRPYQPRSVAIRIVTILVGAAAIFWGASVLPETWRYSALVHIARHIVAGDLFKAKALEELKPVVEGAEQQRLCDPEASRAAAIVHLRLLEMALADGDHEAIDPLMRSSQVSIRNALTCSPVDPFLWLVLYWVEINRNGYSSKDLNYLRMSYVLGPNEGWIALKRNGLALAIFDQLPAELRDTVVAEFADLLNSGFEGEAEANLVGPGWKIRGRLLAKLKDVKQDFREDFARGLYRNGYDVVVPGVRLREARPWD